MSYQPINASRKSGQDRRRIDHETQIDRRWICLDDRAHTDRWTRKPTSEPASFDSPAATAPAMTEPALAPPQATAPETVPTLAWYRDRLMARRTEPVRQPAHHRRVVVRERPIRLSVAIVGASAGTGAAIGALAGGGKGAGIGALVAGAGGFIYDRLTHEKKTME